MKKLMVAIAAVATAFGLYADEPVSPDPGCTSYTDFKSFTVGALADTTAADTTATWVIPTGDKSTIEAIDHPMTDVPKIFGTRTEAGNSLKVETTLGNPVYRNAASTILGADGNAYADFQASFTVFDSDPEFTAYSDAKVAIWLQEELDGDDVTGTNLWLSAGFVGGDPKSYNCGSVEKYDLEDWNRVTVKVIGNISSDSAVPGIVVFINKKVATVDESYDIGTVALKPSAKVWADQGALFPSLQTTGGLNGLGFDGKGYIDNVAYTTTTPFSGAADSDYFTITWDTTKVASLTVADGTGYTVDTSVAGKATIVFDQGVAVSPVAYSWVGEGNWMDGNGTATPDASGSTVPVATDIKEAEALFNGAKKTLADAVDAANEAEGAGVLKLLKDVTGDIVIENANAEITIDLGGWVLTGTSGANTIDGTVVVSNGTVNATGVNNAFFGDKGVIVDGIFNGVVGGEELSILGGQFRSPDNNKTDLDAFAPTGYEFVLKGSYYELERIKNYVVQINNDESKKYESLAEAVAAAQSGDTIALIDDYEFDSSTEKVLFPDGVTFDLAGQTLTVAAVKNGFGTAADAKVTLTDSATTKGKISMTSSDYGFAVLGGSELTVACCIEEISASHPVFDIYGATVNCGADANIKGASDIFRFKDDGLTSTVNVTGGTYVSTESGDGGDKLRCIFQHYKSGHIANINITGGAFTFNNYLIDAYQQSGKDAPVLNFTPLGANNAARFSKQVLVSDVAGSIITEATVLAADCKVVVDTAIAGGTWYKVAEIDYATLKLTKDNGVKSLSATNAAGDVFNDGATFDKDLAVRLYACYELNETGVELDTENSVLEVTMNDDQTIKVFTKPLGTPYPEWIPDDPEVKGKYDVWKGKTCPDGDTQLTAEDDLEDAFLLDCDPGVNALKAAKAAFKIASIEYVERAWQVKVVNPDGTTKLIGQNEAYGNGYVDIISVKEEKFPTAGEDANFFQATLTFKPVLK